MLTKLMTYADVTIETLPAPLQVIECPGDMAVPARSRPGLLGRCGAWIRRLKDAQSLSEIEPRMARDIGVPPGRNRCPEGYGVDPRPLWGIGLTPQPTAPYRPIVRSGKT